ncbi:elongation factor P [Cytophagaceae bacterium DM2B3-1]|uniref:Elongation factor P n=1 Tax=Xanthocytophaga flava TaxID=3048013 RepID=A0AAE3QK08_9BACT|nr:elongation factor P [Xanthocytophaga flavus]MDJ1466224.1 elongation factor P [Xanthocytophaga flavus]MDJ1478895.1 elongation factor P [Xanthocytophaga flavus]MDJ1495429.1 elongation factor P [Xanthocytophaga flavus]
MAQISDISRGTFIRYNNELVQVVEYEHRTPGNLRAFYQVKMRNVRTGKLVENRFRPSEECEIVRVETRDYQYLYRDGENLVFMDTETYDQIYVPEATVGENADLLKESMVVKISMDADTPVSVELPTSIEVEVTYTEPGIQGDTATKTLKPATIETGAIVSVPLFVNIGDKIKVDTRTREYMSRVK